MTPKSRLALGTSLPDWTKRALPRAFAIEGRFCRIEPLAMASHDDDLLAAFRATEAASWTYLFVGPFADDAAIRTWLTDCAESDSYVYFAIIERESGRAAGICAYMRPDPANGVVEIGNIHYADRLKRKPAATEAMYLLMRHAFDQLGYRRYEWKCNALNAPSRRAALRLGFRFEGLFRNHQVVKGHNRDTAWFSIIDSEWPALRVAFDAWLAATNFDADGRQRASLDELIAASRGA